jgi:kynurenine formamidase
MKTRDDEKGRNKEINKDIIVGASELIKNGKVYDLSMEIKRSSLNTNRGNKDIFPQYNLITYLASEKNYNSTSTKGITWQTELIVGGFHDATHIDALSHIQYNGKIFNKFIVKEETSSFGVKKCGAETISPIVSRGILLDIAGLYNTDKLKDDHVVTKKEVQAFIKDKDLKIQFGDTILIRTGKIKDFYKQFYMDSGPGIGVEAARWLFQKGMCVLGADYSCVEGNSPKTDFSVHKEMLYKNGVYILENLFLEELSENKIYVFFFICTPIKITGSTGSWIRPIAIT